MTASLKVVLFRRTCHTWGVLPALGPSLDASKFHATHQESEHWTTFLCQALVLTEQALQFLAWSRTILEDVVWTHWHVCRALLWWQKWPQVHSSCFVCFVLPPLCWVSDVPWERLFHTVRLSPLHVQFANLSQCPSGAWLVLKHPAHHTNALGSQRLSKSFGIAVQLRLSRTQNTDCCSPDVSDNLRTWMPWHWVHHWCVPEDPRRCDLPFVDVYSVYWELSCRPLYCGSGQFAMRYAHNYQHASMYPAFMLSGKFNISWYLSCNLPASVTSLQCTTHPNTHSWCSAKL